jgi:hypothetical protein
MADNQPLKPAESHVALISFDDRTDEASWIADAKKVKVCTGRADEPWG